MRRRRLPEPFTFFLDECFGRHSLKDAIQENLLPGERVVVRASGTLDEVWLRDGSESWICLTKDGRLVHVPNELEAVRSARIGLFLLSDASGDEQARRVVAALPIMRRVARTHDLAFIGRITTAGEVLVLYENGDRLPNPKRVKPKIRER